MLKVISVVIYRYHDKTDNNFSPVNLADDYINENNKSATSSVFGLLTRKAIYREGLGAVLTLSKEDETALYLSPNRKAPDQTTPYPYGNAAQNDTIFNNIDYNKLNNIDPYPLLNTSKLNLQTSQEHP